MNVALTQRKNAIQNIHGVIFGQHPHAREELKQTLKGLTGLDIVTATNSVRKVALTQNDQTVDVILHIVHPPIGDGWREETGKLAALFKPVLVLSHEVSHHFVADVIKMGASGFLPLNSSRKSLLTAIMSIKKYGAYLQQEYQHHLLKKVQNSGEPSADDHTRVVIDRKKLKEMFSRREMDVLELLVNGNNPKQICEQLFISANTLRNHMNSLRKKAGTTNRNRLVLKSFREQVSYSCKMSIAILMHWRDAEIVRLM